MKLVFSFLILMLLLPHALAVPGPANKLFGSIDIEGFSAPDGTAIQAKVGGDVYTAFTSGGKFGDFGDFLVEDPDWNREGDLIEIFVNYKKADEIAFESGGYTLLRIALENTCGDGYCLGSDSCSSCSSDCGTCSAPLSSGGQNPGSAGSNTENKFEHLSTQICIEQWECSEWGECEKGEQKRLCRDNSFCKTFKLSPDEKRNCEQEQFGESGGLQEKLTDIRPSFLGAVIGEVGASGGVALIFVILIIAAAVVVFLVRKRK